MDLQEVVRRAMDCMHLAPGRDNGWEFVNEISGFVKSGEFLD